MKIYQVATDGFCAKCKTHPVKLYFIGRSQKAVERATDWGEYAHGFCSQCLIEKLIESQLRDDFLAFLELRRIWTLILDKQQYELLGAWDKFIEALRAYRGYNDYILDED